MFEWRGLYGLGQAVAAYLIERNGEGQSTPTDLIRALEHCAATMPADKFGTDIEYLRGLAFIDVIAAGDDRVVRAEAVFDDGYTYWVRWDLAEASPQSSFDDPGVARSQPDTPMGVLLPRMLAALQAGPASAERPVWSGRLDREEHERLNTALRTRLADAINTERNEVFLIRRSDGAWQIETSPELNRRIADSVMDAGLSVGEAFERLADDPDNAIPEPQDVTGIGTIAHGEVDNLSLSSITAYCDQTVHAAVWVEGEPAPIWEITAADHARSEAAPVAKAFRRLLARLTGTTE
jgi:hypothetical protein